MYFILYINIYLIYTSYTSCYKPILPAPVSSFCTPDSRVTGERRDSQHALEFVRENLDELGQHGLPVVENPFGAWAFG